MLRCQDTVSAKWRGGLRMRIVSKDQKQNERLSFDELIPGEVYYTTGGGEDLDGALYFVTDDATLVCLNDGHVYDSHYGGVASDWEYEIANVILVERP